MIQTLPKGTYIIGVSGGIDSMVLLHMLQQQTESKVVVAHFDHGIRPDSSEDAEFVQAYCALHNITFETQREELGASASEGLARSRRYAFMNQVLHKYEAAALVTAHHQDDRIETAAINMLRGTKRKGFVALQSSDTLQRPLLRLTKEDIRAYAIAHGLEWREDSTNASMDYLRNRVRARLHGRLSAGLRKKLVVLLDTIERDNGRIDDGINQLLDDATNSIPRKDFSDIDALVLFELVAEWLRRHKAVFDKNTIVRICNGVRSLQTGAKIDVDKQYYCMLTKTDVVLKNRV